MQPQKYIFENGVMKLNPEYTKYQANLGHQTTLANPQSALAIVSSTSDTANLPLSEATQESMKIMMDPDYGKKFQSGNLDGGVLLDKISGYFSEYEIPIGVINKLLALMASKLHFIVDDSGSMTSPSDVLVSEASQHMKNIIDPNGTKIHDKFSKMTRWQEAEDRLHIMMDLLAFIPTEGIRITFLKGGKEHDIYLSQSGKDPEQFRQYAHYEISKLFSNSPSGGTPIFGKLTQEFAQNCSGENRLYLLTDGEPNDVTSPDEVTTLICKRANPEKTPFTFHSCTNKPQETEWMKKTDKLAPFTAHIDDFKSTVIDVVQVQGKAFPYTRGLWIVSLLVAATNPHDLDQIDEAECPFTRKTMNDLLGYRLSDTQYKYYFDNFPNSQKFMHLYSQFCREDILAKDINLGTGYGSSSGNQQQFLSQQPTQPPSYPSYGNYNTNTYSNNPNSMWQQPQQPQGHSQPTQTFYNSSLPQQPTPVYPNTQQGSQPSAPPQSGYQSAPQFNPSNPNSGYQANQQPNPNNNNNNNNNYSTPRYRY